MDRIKAWIDSTYAWCKQSETIVWARLQVLVGAVWTVLSVTDLSPVLAGKYMTYWLIFSGVVTELLRRRNDPTM